MSAFTGRHVTVAGLGVSGSSAARALARIEQVSPATASSTVGGLEAADLVARRKRGGDARSVVVQATEAGRRVLAEGRVARLVLMQDGLAALSTQEREALVRGIGILERVLSTPAS